MIYGDMLLHFSELFRTVEYFTQKPVIGAGYKDKSEIKTARIILQSGMGLEIKGTSGRLSGRNNWKVYDFSDSDVIWVEKDSPLKVGYYIKQPDQNNQVYAITKEIPWQHEGGFRVLEIERVQGNNQGTTNTLQLSNGVY